VRYDHHHKAAVPKKKKRRRREKKKKKKKRKNKKFKKPSALYAWRGIEKRGLKALKMSMEGDSGRRSFSGSVGDIGGASA
jgi:hypothetical protein